MRSRDKVIGSLEGVYREAYEAAQADGTRERMQELDFGFQRDQLILEVLLDLRDALTAPDADEKEKDPSLLERAKAVRKFTKLGGR